MDDEAGMPDAKRAMQQFTFRGTKLEMTPQHESANNVAKIELAEMAKRVTDKCVKNFSQKTEACLKKLRNDMMKIFVNNAFKPKYDGRKIYF